MEIFVTFYVPPTETQDCDILDTKDRRGREEMEGFVQNIGPETVSLRAHLRAIEVDDDLGYAATGCGISYGWPWYRISHQRLIQSHKSPCVQIFF